MSYIEDKVKEFDKELDTWMESSEHRGGCCSWDEGQYCCLDIIPDDDYRPKGRNFIKDFIRTSLEEYRKEFKSCILKLSKRGIYGEI